MAPPRSFLRPSPRLLALAFAAQIALTAGLACAQTTSVPIDRNDLATACGSFPNPDLGAPFEPPIYDYMSFRKWFIHQPGASTIGRLDWPEPLEWKYKGPDRFTLPLQGMTTFDQPVADGTHVSAYYNPTNGAVGAIEVCDTATIYVVVRAKDIPTGLPTVEHVPIVTDRGVTLGMTEAQVKALVGPTDMFPQQRHDEVLLYRWSQPSTCKRCPPDWFTARFDFENDQLIAMSYQVWLHPDIRYHFQP